ncbi:MAG: HAMP domain-containing histidine kinase [Oscillospiraceae bacterium]|nr:HAMP domain-containing histidine kinase [Candidatus Ruminococcus equi]
MTPKNKKGSFSVKLSLFKKYLGFGFFILLISFVALGLTMYFFVTDYWEGQKKISLIENANQVAEVVEASSSYNSQNRVLIVDDPDLFTLTISTISKSIDGDIFVVNNKGKCQYCSEQTDCVHINNNIPSSILAKTAGGEFFESGNLDGFYKDSYYTAGVPITARSQGINVIVAFCYVSTRSTFVSQITMSFMKIFITAALLTMLMVILLVMIMSYTMVRPLKIMSNAAKKFAVGDFSIRVPVTSDDEIGELATALNYMADSLSASEGMRRSFIANVSHELKTPMTTIAGFIDGMLDGTIPIESQPHYMSIVSNEVKRLSRLVTSMLSLSRIDNGELKVSRQDFELFSTIITILMGFEQKITERKIDIRGLDDFKSCTVNADPDLMYQVIYNLIENAVKFTNEGGYIEFTLVETKYDVSVSITNSGAGIPPEDIRYIFDRFYKTDKSRSIDKKGMGLGLFISKSIMRLHSGDIFVESEVNKYCRFTFRLPKIITQKPSKQNKQKKYIETTATTDTEE